jgi:hypothetical protein
LKDLDAEVDINSAWETTVENIKISAEERLSVLYAFALRNISRQYLSKSFSIRLPRTLDYETSITLWLDSALLNFFLFIYNLNQQSEFTFYELMLWLLQCLDGESSSGESQVPQIRSVGQFLSSRLFSSLTSSVLSSGFFVDFESSVMFVTGQNYLTSHL